MKLEIPPETKSQRDFIEGYLAAARALEHDLRKMMEGAQAVQETSLVVRHPGFRLEKRESPTDYLNGYLIALHSLQSGFRRLINTAEINLDLLKNPKR